MTVSKCHLHMDRGMVLRLFLLRFSWTNWHANLKKRKPHWTWKIKSNIATHTHTKKTQFWTLLSNIIDVLTNLYRATIRLFSTAQFSCRRQWIILERLTENRDMTVKEVPRLAWHCPKISHKHMRTFDHWKTFHQWSFPFMYSSTSTLLCLRHMRCLKQSWLPALKINQSIKTRTKLRLNSFYLSTTKHCAHF